MRRKSMPTARSRSAGSLTEQLKHVIEGGGVPRDQARPSIRELAGCLGINPNTVTRAIEDLKRSAYRPLRPCPEAPEPSSIPGRPPSKGATR
jgi:DNA-binding transcriptional MocR family regulator